MSNIEVVLTPTPLNKRDFSPYGDILEAQGDPSFPINDGFCERFHDRAQMEFGPEGRAGISLFKAKPRSLPYQFDLLERHPDGSQAFIPMSMHPFLVIVAGDDNGTPTGPVAFITAPGQGINLHRNVWHGVLTPLYEPGLFAVIDRIGNTPNIEVYTTPNRYIITEL